MECVKTSPSKRPADLKEVARRLEIMRHAMNRQAAHAAQFGCVIDEPFQTVQAIPWLGIVDVEDVV